MTSILRSATIAVASIAYRTDAERISQKGRESWEEYWEHNHVDPPADDGEEEIYTALTGKATLRIAGVEHPLEPGVFARVGPAERRKITTGAEGVQLLCIGGARGKAYEPLPIVELGGPTGF